jgi:hypothetical protein
LSNVFSDSDRSDQPVPADIPKDLLSLPISFFENVRDNGSKGFFEDINYPITWQELCEILVQFAVTPYKHKAEAPLFSPTVFAGTRCVENATVSAAAVIDADKGFDIHAAERFLIEKQIEAILYTTASNTDGSRFRVIVPLLSAVDPETHKAVVKAICAFLKPGWKPDTSKSNCYSLFYVPGRYAGAQNEFTHIEGTVFSAEAWLQLGGQTPLDGGKAAVALANGHDTVRAHIKDLPTATTWNSSFDCPYVEQAWIQEYLGLTDDFYNGLYQFMCRVALSALRQGIELSSMTIRSKKPEENSRNQTPPLPAVPGHGQPQAACRCLSPQPQHPPDRKRHQHVEGRPNRPENPIRRVERWFVESGIPGRQVRIGSKLADDRGDGDRDHGDRDKTCLVVLYRDAAKRQVQNPHLSLRRSHHRPPMTRGSAGRRDQPDSGRFLPW